MGTVLVCAAVLVLLVRLDRAAYEEEMDRARRAIAAQRAERSADRIPASDGARLAWLYRHGEVVNREDREDGTAVTVRLSPADRARFEQNQTTG